MTNQVEIQMLEAEIQPVQSHSDSINRRAHAVEIVTDAGVEAASEFLKDVASAKKVIEDRRQFFVRPLNEQVKKINDMFKALVEPVLQADSIVRQKVLAYRQKQADLARKEQQRLNELAAKEQAKVDKKAERAGVEAPKLLVPVVAPPPTKLGNVVMPKVWKFEVVDPAAIERRFLSINETAIREAVRAGEREIPGVRVFQVEQVTVR